MQRTKPKTFNAVKGLALGTGGLLLAAAQPSFAQQNPTIENLQTQIQEMQVQMDELERDVIVPDAPGSFMLPGTDTSMKIGGYVKLDFIYDLDRNVADSHDVASFDVDNTDEDSSFRAHARQSRINVSTSTPTDIGPVTTFIEGDFFGSTLEGTEGISNSDGFRIRHAYGTHGRWLAGQTWSNFMQFTAYPTTVDFGGPVGVSFIRQAQLRYTMPVANGALSFSAENAATFGFAGTRDEAPDLTARYKGTFGNLAIETGAVGRFLKTDDPSATGDDNAFGYGLMLAGSFQVTDSTRLMASGIYGDGVGRYVYLDFNNGAARIENGDLETNETYSYNVAVAQQWTNRFSSSLSYGYVEFDDETRDETQEIIHFSHFYKVAEPVIVGAEISYGDLQLEDGRSADNTRLQASVQYNF